MSFQKNISAQAFYWPLRVYYEDTDAAGVVYYANYLKFFERARTEWLRKLGVDQHTLVQEEGIAFMVASAHLTYHAPARLDDELMVVSMISTLKRASLCFSQSIWRKEVCLVSGECKVACVNALTLRPTGIRSDIYAQFFPLVFSDSF